MSKIIIYGFMAVCTILFLAVLPLGHDLHFHLYRVGAMAEELQRTGYSVPIRILSSSYNDYGYAVPLFYGDLLLYLPALLVCAGFKVNVAIRVLIVMTFWLAFAITRYEIARVTGNKELALYTSAFYVFSNYFLINLVIRMAVGEATAMIFAPMFLISLYGLINKPKKGDWIHVGLSVSGMLLCHNLSTLIFLTVGSILAVVWWVGKRKETKRILAELTKSVVLFIGMTASFLLPFFEATSYEKYQIPGNGKSQFLLYGKSGLSIWDFLFPFEIEKVFNQILGTGINTDSWHPGGIGVTVLIGFGLSYICRKEISKAEDKTARNLFIGYLLSTAVYLIMFIKPLVTVLGNWLGFMQFTWRLLEVCTIFWSLYIGYLIIFYCKKRINLILTCFILAGLYSIVTRYAFQIYLNVSDMSYVEENNSEAIDKYKMEYSPNDGDNLYLPKGVSIYLYENRGEVVLDNKGNSVGSLLRNQGRLQIEFPSGFEGMAELPLYMYKGYVAKDTDSDEYLPISLSENGLAQISVSPNNRHVLVWYKGTPIQRVGDAISLLTLVMLVLSTWRIKRSNNGNK